MKKWNTIWVCLFVAICIFLNLGGHVLTAEFQPMFWFDSFGTVLAAYLGGPFCGCVVGVTANLIFGMVNRVSGFYALTSIAMGLVVGFAAKKQKLSTFFGTMETSSMATLLAVAISVPLNLLISNGMTGNIWGDGVIGFYQQLGCPRILTVILGQLYIDFMDKTVTLLALFLLLEAVHWYRNRRVPQTVEQTVEMLEEEAEHPELTKMVGWILAVCLGVSAACSLSGTAKAEEQETELRYNDYVQTVYSSNNGLPCGEANDIVETHDGIIWVGTYAGLYRYNGMEFWRMDYSSVHNANCLYVDEEGRLWIGTNDSGLSIAIDEEIVNVIDQEKGLPSNTVRSIIKSSDGYYYIGTTNSLQILTLNSGLKKVNTLSEVSYVEDSSADEHGNVVCITHKGLMFLLNRAQILSSVRLVNGNESFNCCLFDSEGMLLAGTSTNHIYRYDISGGGFERIGEVICEGISNINDMKYLDDGVLFITSDDGVGYLDSSLVFHRINTNNFNNSIDHMLVDYQGNFWFTSSRLGLLRMAQSSFKDIYSNIGMDSRVCNSVEMWNGNFYIGTDKGLDAVDSQCRHRVVNTLTEQMSGIRIRCLKVDSQGALWICTYRGGLMEIEADGTQHLYTETDGMFGDYLRTVTELRDGTIVAGGDTGISFIRDHKVTKTIKKSDGLTNPMVMSIIELDDGRILAGTNGEGIAIIIDGQVKETIARKKDELLSGVILRLVQDPKSSGVFVVTSNSLCYLEENGSVRPLVRFPYYNNYDIWVKDENTLFVMSSAGIYITERDDLVEGEGPLTYDLLDARRGLSSALTANSWNYARDGILYLPCDNGIFSIDSDNYDSGAKTYRMSIASMRIDGELERIERGMPIHIDRNVSRIELYPEIINYTIQDPNTGYMLEGFDANWTVMPRSELTSIVYTNLLPGNYTLHLAVFDNQDQILEQRQYRIIKEREIYDYSWFNVYIIVVAMLAAVWFAVYLFFTYVRRKMERQQREIELKDRQLEMGNQTILAIANTVDAKDVRTSQHSLRVSIYSKMIGKELGFSDEECDNLERAARMHDIGKIGIPDRILNKPSRLDEDEYKTMQSHVTRGATILKGFTLIDHAVDGALYHHERYDGKGYPNGLKGEEIPLYGRIIGVADAFDAMTANRVYRKQMDFNYVLNEMRNGRGTQFDPQFVDILLKLIEDGKIDLKKLYSGHTDDSDETKQES